MTFADVGMMLVRLSRPLPGPLSDELNARLGHRHLDLLVAGLRSGQDAVDAPLEGPELSREDLNKLADR